MRGTAAVAAFVAVAIALPLAAEAFFFPRETPADSHPYLRTNTARWYDYLRQASEDAKIQISPNPDYD